MDENNKLIWDSVGINKMYIGGIDPYEGNGTSTSVGVSIM